MRHEAAPVLPRSSRAGPGFKDSLLSHARTTLWLVRPALRPPTALTVQATPQSAPACRIVAGAPSSARAPGAGRIRLPHLEAGAAVTGFGSPIQRAGWSASTAA